MHTHTPGCGYLGRGIPHSYNELALLFNSDVNDIVAVQEEIMDASAHYYDIGVKLGLKSDDLNGIKDAVPDHATAIRMIMSRWLKRQYNVQQHMESQLGSHL